MSKCYYERVTPDGEHGALVIRWHTKDGWQEVSLKDIGDSVSYDIPLWVRTGLAFAQSMHAVTEDATTRDAHTAMQHAEILRCELEAYKHNMKQVIKGLQDKCDHLWGDVKEETDYGPETHYFKSPRRWSRVCGICNLKQTTEKTRVVQVEPVWDE